MTRIAYNAERRAYERGKHRSNEPGDDDAAHPVTRNQLREYHMHMTRVVWAITSLRAFLVKHERRSNFIRLERQHMDRMLTEWGTSQIGVEHGIVDEVDEAFYREALLAVERADPKSKLLVTVAP